MKPTENKTDNGERAGISNSACPQSAHKQKQQIGPNSVKHP
jgi:hypothetical protein